MHARPASQPFHTQLFDLTLIQLANWRWSWTGLLLSSTLAPVIGTIALGVFAQDSGPTALGYVLTGNLVMSLLFGTFDRVAAHMAYMRMVGRLDFFATLPVYRAALVLATVFAFSVLALRQVVLGMPGRNPLVVDMAVLSAVLVVSLWYIGRKMDWRRA
ncbi:MAG: hypothetical protein GYB65_16445 [Chloroflexi bacterium]|nr:hypothetical protein [Chloroflexota bacterium]